MKWLPRIFLVISLLAVAVGFVSCYQNLTDETPQMYPGSEGTDALPWKRAERFLISFFIGAVTLGIAAYLRTRQKRKQQ